MKKFLAIVVACVASSFAQGEVITDDTSQIVVGVHPLDGFVEYDSETQEVTGGFDIELWQMIAQEIGMTPDDYVFQTTHQFGDLVSGVRDNRFDCAISTITITHERESNGIDFSHQYLPAALGILLPIEQEPTWQDFIVGFIESTAQLIPPFVVYIVLIVVFGLVLWLLERSDDEGIPNNIAGIGEAIWCMHAVASTIGFGDRVPKCKFGRSWSILGFFIGAIIIGNVIGTISAYKVEVNVSNTIQEVADLKTKHVGTVANTTSVAALADRNISNVSEYDSVMDAIVDLRLGEIDAVVYDDWILRHYAENEGEGKVTHSGIRFALQSYGIAFPDDHAAIEDVNQAILKLQRDGQIDDLKAKYFGTTD